MVVVGVHGDAAACGDLKPGLFVEVRVVNYFALGLRQVVPVIARDVVEPVPIVLGATDAGRGRVVLAMVVPDDEQEPALRRAAPRGRSSLFCLVTLS
jgi:hypothetical protein